MAKILIVDDSGTIRSLIKKILEPDAYQVDEAGDGSDALDKIQKSTPDLVITDINMPIMDGFVLATKIRGQDLTKKTPIIIISTEASQEMKSKAKEVGANAWIVKPPQPETLRDVVKKFLQPK